MIRMCQRERERGRARSGCHGLFVSLRVTEWIYQAPSVCVCVCGSVYLATPFDTTAAARFFLASRRHLRASQEVPE